MSTIEERYKKLTKNIEELNRKKLLIEGQRKAYMEELNQLGFDSVEDATKEIDSLKVKLESLYKKISNDLTKYETEMEKVKNVF